MTPEQEAEVLRRTAEAVMAEGWGGRAWRLCAYAWLTCRADRLSPKVRARK